MNVLCIFQAIMLVVGLYCVILALLLQLGLYRSKLLFDEMCCSVGKPYFWELAAYYEGIFMRSWHARLATAMVRFVTLGRMKLP